MKKYKVTLNGTSYELEVEEIDAGYAPGEVPNSAAIFKTNTATSPVAVPVQASASAAVEKTLRTPTGGVQTIESPMPGTILDIRVKSGDTVTEGQALLILEAMKMENEIMAPRAGIIDMVQVTKGASVNAGDVLLSIK